MSLRNRSGMLGFPIVSVVSLAVLVVIFIAFWLLFGYFSDAEFNRNLKLSGEAQDFDYSARVLLNLLRSEVGIDGVNINVGDLILWSLHNKDITKLNNVLGSTLNKGDYFWELNIYEGNVGSGKLLHKFQRTTRELGKNAKYFQVTIPDYYEARNIGLEFIYTRNAVLSEAPPKY